MRRVLETEEVGDGAVMLEVDASGQDATWYIKITSADGSEVTLACSDAIDAEGTFGQLTTNVQNIY